MSGRRVRRIGPVFVGRGRIVFETASRSDRLTLDPAPIAWTVSGHRVYADGRLYAVALDPYAVALELAYGTADTIDGEEVYQ